MYVFANLRLEDVSLLERCPHLRGVIYEGFHCSPEVSSTNTCMH